MNTRNKPEKDQASKERKSMVRNEDQVLIELQRITKLLLLLVIKEQTQNEQIETLYRGGFQPKEIATFLGTTANSVKVTLSKIRNKK